MPRLGSRVRIPSPAPVSTIITSLNSGSKLPSGEPSRLFAGSPRQAATSAVRNPSPGPVSHFTTSLVPGLGYPFGERSPPFVSSRQAQHLDGDHGVGRGGVGPGLRRGGGRGCCLNRRSIVSVEEGNASISPSSRRRPGSHRSRLRRNVSSPPVSRSDGEVAVRFRRVPDQQSDSLLNCYKMSNPADNCDRTNPLV